MLLAPIARLLNISLDTLLSFREALTEAEISTIVREIDTRFKTETYDEVFQWAKEKIELYPNCTMLIWQLANILDAQRLFKDMPDVEKYDEFILKCYERVLNSEEEAFRTRAADSMFGYYYRKEQYEKAESFLKYYSEQNPQRKIKQAQIFSKTDRRDEAYKAYEKLLFSGYQMMSAVLNSIYLMAMQDNNREKAHKLVEKQEELARVFEMGTYHEASCWLDLATAEKDADSLVLIMKKMLESIENITEFTESDLYEHMAFKKSQKPFIEELKMNLLNCFRDEETYGYLKNDKRYQDLFIK